MPAPAIYVVTTVAIVGAVAVSLALKEFLYEPHIAPKIEEWAEGFVARRRARRGQKNMAYPVAVPTGGYEDPYAPYERKERMSDYHDYAPQKRQSVELENLVANEVRQWRTEVDRSQSHRGILRHRGNAGPQASYPFDQPNRQLPFVPLNPTQIGFKNSPPPAASSPQTPRSPSSQAQYLSPRGSPLQERATISRSSTHPVPPATGRLPTARSPTMTSPGRPLSRQSIPSLSQSYPLELDQEHGLEFLSAPSSRAESPFSNFSHPLSVRGASPTPQSSGTTAFHSFTSAGLAASPLQRPSSRTMSDLDFLSDIGEHDQHVNVNVMSPRSVISDISMSTFDDFGDEVRSERSGSSWASAGPRNR